MQVLKSDVDLAAFWERVRTARVRALLLDYDGTLAPFCVERVRAVPYPGIRELLDDLMRGGHTRTVIVSGRPAREVQTLLELDRPAEVWGDHGWERSIESGASSLSPLPPGAVAVLEQAWRAATAAGLSGACEYKRGGIALHWRGNDADSAAALRILAGRIWRPMIEQGGVALREFDGGIELRAVGADKGRAVRTVLEELAEPAAIAYAGDDSTDEDAFRAVPDHGLSVLVRPELRRTAADVWIRPPGELLEFLRDWLRVCSDRP